MKKKDEKIYSYGVLIGILFNNFILTIFTTIISTKDGFDYFGLYPIWAVIIIFSISAILFYKSKQPSEDRK